MSKAYTLIRSPRQIRALASPLRQEIVDCLLASGPMSVAELSAELGKPADSLYYHIRLLKAVQLIQELGQRSTGRREESVFDLIARPLRVHYQPSSAANRKAVNKMSRAMHRLAERDFERALESKHVTVDGRHRNVWAGRLVGRFGKKDLVELNQIVDRLNELFDAGRGRDSGKLQSFCYSMAPLQDRDLREKE